MASARERPAIERCAFCGCPDYFMAEGTVLMDFYDTGQPSDTFWKFWCDRCDRATLVEAGGCAVPIKEYN